MKHIAKIRLIKERTLSDYDTRDLDLTTGDQVMVEWEDGLKMGTVVKLTESDSEISSQKHHSRVIRKVTDADLDYESRKEHKEQEAHQACTAKIKEMELPMNLVRVEHIPNINKFICYFSAEGRVDFRNLVKTLASDFHARRLDVEGQCCASQSACGHRFGALSLSFPLPFFPFALSPCSPSLSRSLSSARARASLVRLLSPPALQNARMHTHTHTHTHTRQARTHTLTHSLTHTPHRWCPGG